MTAPPTDRARLVDQITDLETVQRRLVIELLRHSADYARIERLCDPRPLTRRSTDRATERKR